MAQLVGHHPAKSKVAGSVPDQGICMGSAFGSPEGHLQEASD